jgi:hypothetical protein
LLAPDLLTAERHIKVHTRPADTFDPIRREKHRFPARHATHADYHLADRPFSIIHDEVVYVTELLALRLKVVANQFSGRPEMWVSGRS